MNKLLGRVAAVAFATTIATFATFAACDDGDGNTTPDVTTTSDATTTSDTTTTTDTVVANPCAPNPA